MMLPAQRTLDVAIMIIQVFISESARGISIPTLFLYVKSVAPSNPQLVMGLAISAFSFGRLIGSYVFGALADYLGSSRTTLQIASAILVISNIIFAFSGSFGLASSTILVISRLFIGCASGTISVSRAFMARISRKTEKVKYMSWITLAQYLGFSVSPLLAVYIPIDDTSQFFYGVLPGLVMASLSLAMIPLLFLSRAVDSEASGEEYELVQAKSEETPAEQNDRKKEAFLLFLFLNFVLRGILGVLETFGANQYQGMKSIPAELDIIQDSAEFFFLLGLLGSVIFLYLNQMVKKFGSATMLLLGIILFSVGSLLLVPEIMNKNFTVFVCGMVLILSFASPICQTLTISSYSEIVKANKQGREMGILTAAGSLGRIIFPFIGGASYKAIAWINIVLCIVSGIWVFVFYNRHLFKNPKYSEIN